MRRGREHRESDAGMETDTKKQIQTGIKVGKVKSIVLPMYRNRLIKQMHHSVLREKYEGR